MKVILFMAVSLNGIIARENNEEDFLSDDNWITFAKLVNDTGCVIWGRRTHEVVKKWEQKFHDQIRNVKKVIVSGSGNVGIGEDYVLAKSPEEALSALDKDGFEQVIISGGSVLNTSFAKAGFIDEVIVNVEPVMVGKGIPLFSPDNFELQLELLEISKISKNIIQLHYKVNK